MLKLEGHQIYLDCVVLAYADNTLIFSSAFGGESSLKAWLGYIESSTKKSDFSRVIHKGCFEYNLHIKDKKDLYTKRQKVQNATYEHFVHYFVYDKHIHYQDGDIFSHLLIENEDDLNAKLWERIKEMTATPVLDQWQDQIVNRLFTDEKIIKNIVLGNDNLVSYSIHLGSQFDLNEIVVELLNDKALYLPT